MISQIIEKLSSKVFMTRDLRSASSDRRKSAHEQVYRAVSKATVNATKSCHNGGIPKCITRATLCFIIMQIHRTTAELPVHEGDRVYVELHRDKSNYELEVSKVFPEKEKFSLIPTDIHQLLKCRTGELVTVRTEKKNFTARYKSMSGACVKDCKYEFIVDPELRESQGKTRKRRGNSSSSPRSGSGSSSDSISSSSNSILKDPPVVTYVPAQGNYKRAASSSRTRSSSGDSDDSDSSLATSSAPTDFDTESQEELLGKQGHNRPVFDSEPHPIPHDIVDIQKSWDQTLSWPVHDSPERSTRSESSKQTFCRDPSAEVPESPEQAQQPFVEMSRNSKKSTATNSSRELTERLDQPAKDSGRPIPRHLMKQRGTSSCAPKSSKQIFFRGSPEQPFSEEMSRKSMIPTPTTNSNYVLSLAKRLHQFERASGRSVQRHPKQGREYAPVKPSKLSKKDQMINKMAREDQERWWHARIQQLRKIERRNSREEVEFKELKKKLDEVVWRKKTMTKVYKPTREDRGQYFQDAKQRWSKTRVYPKVKAIFEKSDQLKDIFTEEKFLKLLDMAMLEFRHYNENQTGDTSSRSQHYNGRRRIPLARKLVFEKIIALTARGGAFEGKPGALWEMIMFDETRC